MTPIRLVSYLLAFVGVALGSCGESHPYGPDVDTPRVITASVDDDKEVVDAVLRDFASWDEATFGNFKGVLYLDPKTHARADESMEGIKNLAPTIAPLVTDGLIAEFIRRNKTAVPITDLVVASRWAKVGELPAGSNAFSNLPPGAKAVGSITLPAFDQGRTRAFLRIYHSWSIHDAVITYLLIKSKGQWQVVKRDQFVAV